jgi:hypothetical protein
MGGTACPTGSREIGSERLGPKIALGPSMRTTVRERSIRDLLSATLLGVIVGCGSSGGAGQDAGAAGDAEGQDGTAAGDANGGSDAPLGDDTSSVQDSAAGCPSSAPGAGSPCPSVGASCSYGGGICCGGGYTCATGGTWQVLEATCACNTPAVDAGGPCGGQTCQGATSCCGPPECGFCIPNASGVQCPSTCNTRSPDSGVCPATCATTADCNSCPQKSFGGWSCVSGTCQFQG